MRRTKPRPWYSDVPRRLRFEREARALYPSLHGNRVGTGRRSRVVYRVHVALPDFEARTVVITLSNATAPRLWRVTADGPTDSPHRFGDRALCLWHPDADPDLRWKHDEGLLTLVQIVRVHLWQEAYWRETTEWPGPEIPHRRLPSETARSS